MAHWVQIPALMYKVSDLGISASTDRYPQQKQGFPGPWASWLAGPEGASKLWVQWEALVSKETCRMSTSQYINFGPTHTHSITCTHTHTHSLSHTHTHTHAHTHTVSLISKAHGKLIFWVLSLFSTLELVYTPCFDATPLSVRMVPWGCCHWILATMPSWVQSSSMLTAFGRAGVWEMFQSHITAPILGARCSFLRGGV